MANLSAKELTALNDQLNFERVICAKYQAASQEAEDQQLKTCCKKYADQHRQNYNSLLSYLK